MSKRFVIPVSWEVYSTVAVSAETYEEAIRILEDNLDEVPLGEGEYIDDSYRVDYECSELAASHLRNIGGVYIDEDGIHK